MYRSNAVYNVVQYGSSSPVFTGSNIGYCSIDVITTGRCMFVCSVM